MLARDLTNDCRAKAAALVERETIRTGSRMAGYEAVAQMVGVSPARLRAIVCGYENGKLDPTMHNIDEAYRRVTSKSE